jgi:hypothetical protein
MLSHAILLISGAVGAGAFLTRDLFKTQTFNTVFHMLLTIVLSGAVVYAEAFDLLQERRRIAEFINVNTTVYFIVDSIFCALIKSHRVYLPHHIGSLVLCYATYIKTLDSLSMTLLVHLAELSNIMLPAYDLTKRYYKNTWMEKNCCIMTLYTYVPIRAFIMPGVVYQIFAGTECGLLRMLLSGLQLMSWWFSAKLYSRAEYNYLKYTDTDSITHMLYKRIFCYDHNWFPFITDLIHLNAALIGLIFYCHTIQTWFAIVISMVCCCVSCVYYILDMGPAIERLDFSAVNIKITTIGCLLYARIGCFYSMYNIFNIILVACRIGTMHYYKLESKHTRRLHCAVSVVNSFIALRPLICIGDSRAAYVYAVGAFLWVNYLPCYQRGDSLGWKLFNSYGVLHVIVMVADGLILLAVV